MHDRVAEVLAQRAALDRGAGAGVALSVLLHGGLAGLAIYTALHATAPQPASMVSIQFANMPAMTKPSEPAKKAAPPAPKIEEPKPVIAEPQPAPPVNTPPPKPQKNTVPLSPFGQSTKKGSEAPPVAPPAPAAATSTAPEIPIGGTGVTGIEGGDFPHTLYLQAMYRKIGNFWYRPTVQPGTAVTIFFRVERDGRVSESRIVTPSGNSTFDRAALSAIRSASPLNPLPYAYNGTYVGITMVFR